MKSYFLERLSDPHSARAELSRTFPGQADPWLLTTGDGDPIAYLNVDEDEHGTYWIKADVSGRHFDQDEAVLNVLRAFQSKLGGIVADDDDTL